MYIRSGTYYGPAGFLVSWVTLLSLSHVSIWGHRSSTIHFWVNQSSSASGASPGPTAVASHSFLVILGLMIDEMRECRPKTALSYDFSMWGTVYLWPVPPESVTFWSNRLQLDQLHPSHLFSSHLCDNLIQINVSIEILFCLDRLIC
ncbi:hypothetical protein ASPWEDRAFT_641749 [Aspergillus wentii DTO 134E9]|uniref:Uncharacterized protein n=1 Tax=Aspergillus wentii DTO 134E9 TaxID=1073089 RepID=A0A1L9RAC6_ASPWE|nr:uncharacterized protein ASPWEDRAFT_641749 [Aspergillus wentii DTO 134E9]OJJ31885.1 hypothetical protein ASPWEDRAFT_641749 [Aspergillus wentii DTO 134E9]